MRKFTSARGRASAFDAKHQEALAVLIRRVVDGEISPSAQLIDLYVEGMEMGMVLVMVMATVV